MKILELQSVRPEYTYPYGSGAVRKTAAKLGYEIKVGNRGHREQRINLPAKRNRKSDYVIIAADVSIDEPERFNGKKSDFRRGLNRY